MSGPGNEPTLLVDERDDRVVVTLNRPAKRNAINADMVAELNEVCSGLEREPKVLVLTGGVDGFFVGGADVGQLRDRRRDEALAGANLRVFERIRGLPLPSIAAVDGHAIGGGAELAYACDVRIATTRVRFAQPEPELGVLAAGGAAYRLVRLLGESVAKHVLLAGRTLDADDALRTGLVLDVVEPDELLARADEVVDRMLRGSTIALRMTKLAVDAAPEAHPALDLLAQSILVEDEEKFRRMTRFLQRGRRG